MTVTVLKWEKTKACVVELREMMDKDPNRLPRKRLEEIRGFLVYVSRTFEWMKCYLKGLHLTIDSWRPDRDEEGYKIRREMEVELAAKRMGEAFERGFVESLESPQVDGLLEGSRESDPPQTVKAVLRFQSDVDSLLKLTEQEEPPVVKCRVQGACVALYLMGDASGKGFGSGLWHDDGIEYEAGSWSVNYSQESSNYREAENLTERIERLAEGGRLNDRELFIFTDNTTYEGTYYKGHSSSKKLTEIILRLRMLEMKCGCILHVVHVAGSRMKFSGIDGLSRGDLLEGGVLKGDNPWDFIPLNEDADQRAGGRVSEWVRSWWHDEEGGAWCHLEGEGAEEWESGQLLKLSPNDWFRLYEIKGHRLWVPPPAAMATVVELFSEDRLVHPHLAHVFVIPRLMTHLWRRALTKDADLNFSVYPGAPFWPLVMHEPLTVLVVLPLAHTPDYFGPWVVKHRPSTEAFNSKLVAEFQRPGKCGRREFHDLEEQMPGLFEDEHRWSRDLLFKFLHEQGRDFPPVRSGLLRGMLPGLRGRRIPDPKNVGREGGRG